MAKQSFLNNFGLAIPVKFRTLLIKVMLCLYFVLIEVCMHVDVMAEVIIVKIRILMAVCHRLCVGIRREQKFYSLPRR